MAEDKDKREELLKFIDKKAFDVILKTSPDKFKDKDRETFEGFCNCLPASVKWPC